MTELREKLNNIVEEKNTKVIPENLRVGAEAFGVQGTFTSDADATAEDIASGKTAYVNGEKIIGKMQPSLDTTLLTNTNRMFSSNTTLVEAPMFDVSNVTVMEYMFFGCTNLKSCGSYNSSKCSMYNCMFQNCTKLTDVGVLDCTKCTNIQNVFYGCSNLQNFGGFKNIGQEYNAGATTGNSSYTINLADCTKLTHDSLMNVINLLYDLKGNGKNTQRLTIGSTNKNKLTAEEIAIATNKGWTVS